MCRHRGRVGRVATDRLYKAWEWRSHLARARPITYNAQLIPEIKHAPPNDSR